MAAVEPLSGVLVHDLEALGQGHDLHPGGELLLAQMAVGVEHRRDHLHLGLGVPVHQRDFRAGARRRARGVGATGAVWAEKGGDEIGHSGVVIFPVLRPGAPPVGDIDAADPRRDDFSQLSQHQVRIITGLGQGVRPHTQQKALISLPGAVDAEVGGGRRWQ